MFLISTKFGMIPNIVSDIESLKKDRILFIDDFIFRDCIFFHQNISLRDFCNIKKDIKIYLMFKNNLKNQRRIVTSKRGNMSINKEEYDKYIKILQPDYYQDFSSTKIINNINNININNVIKDIKTLEEFNKLKSNTLFGTTFINKLVEENKMLQIIDNQLVVSEDIFDCKCTDLSPGYLKHLLEMKEINFKYYLTIHNYNQLEKILKK
ncbi:queuine tRNA-ribosyltransferase accessory subunit 2 [Vairimorpha necatrix]|uniref:Queuine tRNA-ribosyltransferase accessory subunit 2 n=1 Tax=Vairimorpha necatrix TaxID=6039 RepID=A0AAX4J8E7_9MICR